MKRRFLSIVTALALCLILCPAVAFAEDASVRICGVTMENGWYTVENKAPVKSNAKPSAPCLEYNNGMLTVHGKVELAYSNTYTLWVQSGTLTITGGSGDALTITGVTGNGPPAVSGLVQLAGSVDYYLKTGFPPVPSFTTTNTYSGNITIEAMYGNPAIFGDGLTIQSANNVTLRSNSGSSIIGGDIDITASGEVLLDNAGFIAYGALTIRGASSVTVRGAHNGYAPATGAVSITSSGNVTLQSSKYAAALDGLTIHSGGDVVVSGGSTIVPALRGDISITAKGRISITDPSNTDYSGAALTSTSNSTVQVNDTVLSGPAPVATVKIKEETATYFNLTEAWNSLSGKEGTIMLLRNVTADSPLTVSSGMHVLVEMKDGVTLTNNSTDCFQVKGGTLILASGTVEEGASANSVVFAESGTLLVIGGTYISAGNGLWINSAAEVQLSGGTITAPGTALRYQSPRKVREMLEENYVLKDSTDQTVTSGLDGERLTGGTYTVKRCTHKTWAWTDNGNDTHRFTCVECGIINSTASHSFDGSGTCISCLAREEAQVTIGGTTTRYTTISSAWASLNGKGTIKLPKNVTTDSPLIVSSGMDVTVEMKDGVTLTNNSTDCFQVKGGTLTLASGTVKEGASGNSVVFADTGTLHVIGGTYISEGNGLWINSTAEVQLSGGTITVPDSKSALRYQSPKKVKDMLAKGYALFNAGGIVTSGLGGEKLAGSTYTVKACTHPSTSTTQDNSAQNNNTHTLTCTLCGYEKAETHKWTAYNGKTDGLVTQCTRTCQSCGYVQTFGTLTQSAPVVNVTYGQITGEVSITANMPDSVLCSYYWSCNGTKFSSLSNALSALPIPTDLSAGKSMMECEVEVYASGKRDLYPTFTFTINVARATPAPATPTDLTAVYGQTLADVLLPAGWAWNTPSASVGNIGAHEFPATFTPEDTANYETVSRNLTVAVSPIPRSIAVTGRTDSPTQVTLNAAVITPDGTGGAVRYGVNTTNTAPGEWQVECVFTGLTADTTYYFFAMVEADGNYAKAVSEGVAITPRNYRITLKTGSGGVQYTVSPPSAERKDVYIAAALYEGSGKLCQVRMEPLSLTGDYTGTLPFTPDPAGTDYVVLFLLDRPGCAPLGPSLKVTGAMIK